MNLYIVVIVYLFSYRSCIILFYLILFNYIVNKYFKFILLLFLFNK